MPLLLNGNVYTGAGVAVAGATVELLARNTTSPVLAAYTGGTTAAGLWNFSYTVGADRRTDVRVTNGTSISFLKYDDQIQVSSVETGTLRVINPAFSYMYDIVPAAITADRQLNLPLITATDTLATLGLGQTFTAQHIISVSNAAAFSVGPNGDTNPMFRIVTNVAAAATGIAITGAAAGSRSAIAALSSGANEGLDVDAKGSGTIRLGGTSTGNVVLNRACNVQGTWVADAAWTLPAHTLGGTVTLNGQTFSGTAAGDHTYSGAITCSAAGTALTVTNDVRVSGNLGINQAPAAGGTKLAITTGATDDGIQLRSGAAGSRTSISLGRTASEHYIQSIAVATEIFNGSVAGDLGIRSGGKLLLGTAAAESITIAAAGGAVTVAGATTFSAAGTALTVSNNARIESLGIGVAPSGTAGRLTVNENLIVSGARLDINSVNYSWPSAQGTAGQQLQTDGANPGVLSWAAAGSWREWKHIVRLWDNPQAALAQILATRVYDFRYRPDGRVTTGDFESLYTGVLAEDAPWAMHHSNSIVNPINTLGYMVLGFQAIEARLAFLEDQNRGLQSELEVLQRG